MVPDPNPAYWLKSFLEARELQQPDGRPLYAYRCTAGEFDALQEVLNAAGHVIRTPHLRALVLYAAQWWQRKYDGRRWAWEPLLGSIDWSSVAYTDLYPGVRDAWRWWRIQPVRLPSSTRFLGTFACHGGLPLALIGDKTSPVTRYLRAVLNHTQAYGRVVDDPIELAKDKEHLLRPPTLRRDYVFRLAADLICSVLDLQPYIDSDNPIASLDGHRPDWRESMPLDLGSALALDLLVGLLREAAQGREVHVDDFRVQRFLRHTSADWRLGAELRLPESISGARLALQLGMSSSALPARMEVRVAARGVHSVGVYVHVNTDEEDDYRLAGRQAPLELWNDDAAGEIRLRFLAGDYLGNDLVPAGGASLSELPWAFRADEHECPLIGEGTVSSRASEIVVLANIGDASSLDGAAQQDEVLGRVLWRVREPLTIDTDVGPCTVRPGVAEGRSEEYRLFGERCYEMDCRLPLFRGTPTLQVNGTSGIPKNVPKHEVQWRRTGGDWMSDPGNGTWAVRHVVDGELRFHARVGILPIGMSTKLEPGQDMGEGCVAFRGAEGVRIATEDSKVTIRHDGGAIRAELRAATTDPPTVVVFKLLWPPAPELLVEVPFPGHGAKFLREGQPVGDLAAVNELYGMRAVALSPLPGDKYWIEGELKAPDLGPLVKVAYFRTPLRQTGALHELPLVDVRASIELLLTASSSADASVKLGVVDSAGQARCDMSVSRFANVLTYDPTNAYVELSPPSDGDESEVEAIPISRPATAPVVLRTDGSPSHSVATFPHDFRYQEPWLIVARQRGQVHAQPIAISHPSGTLHEIRDALIPPRPRLAEAHLIKDDGKRQAAVRSSLEGMLDIAEDDAMDQEWEFLTDSLLSTTDLPSSSVDVLVGLTEVPRLLARCLFRLDSSLRHRLWRLEHELPFSWLLVKRDVWWEEAKAAFKETRNALALAAEKEDAVAMSLDRVASVLEEGVAYNSGLRTLATDVSLRLNGERLSQDYVDDKRSVRDQETSNQILLRNSLDDWPIGGNRSEWREVTGVPKLLDALWQNSNEPLRRQPVFDTPVAAALYAFLPKEPARRAIYLIRRLYFHDPGWFALAYGAAWSLLAIKADGLKT